MLTRKNPPKSKDISIEGTGDRSVEVKMIWLYGPNFQITNKTALRLLNNYSAEFDSFRIQLSMSLDTPLLPIFDYVTGRSDLIKKWMGLGEDLLIVGSEKDKTDKEIQKLYKFSNSIAVYIHPDEYQYHVDNMGMDESPTYGEMIQAKKDWIEFLVPHFESLFIIQ